MNWLSSLFAGKSSAALEAEKTAELDKLSKSYDEKIAKAKEREGVPAATGTTELPPAVVGARRKTRRGGKKGKKSRKH